MGSAGARIRRTLDHRTTYRFSMISKRLTDCLSGAFQSKFDLSINGWRVLSVVERFGPLAAFGCRGRSRGTLPGCRCWGVSRATNWR